MPQQHRTIHPTDAQDEGLAGLPLSAAYAYAYLPTVLDDEGRAKDQPAVLNGYLWPLRADEHPTSAMADDIAALVGAGVICRYSAGEQDYLHDPRWTSRQRVARPARSELPPCPVHDKQFDDLVSETLHKVSEQVNAFLGGTGASIDETKVRDTVSRLVEDVTFLVDPEKAASYGDRVRDFLRGGPALPEEPTGAQESPGTVETTGAQDSGSNVNAPGVWEQATDDPYPDDSAR